MEEGWNYHSSTGVHLYPHPPVLQLSYKTFLWSSLEIPRQRPLVLLVQRSCMHMQPVRNIEDTGLSAHVQQLLWAPAAHCYHFGHEELISRSPRSGDGTSTLPTPHHQRNRDMWWAELQGAEQGMDPPAGLALAPEVLPGPQLRLVHLAFRFSTVYQLPSPWHRVGPTWLLKTVPSPAILWLSIILFRSTDFIRETAGFCTDYTESKEEICLDFYMPYRQTYLEEWLLNTEQSWPYCSELKRCALLCKFMPDQLIIFSFHMKMFMLVFLSTLTLQIAHKDKFYF